MTEVPLLPAGMHFLERGWLSSNSLLLFGQHGTALVDSGYGSHASQTVALVEAALRGRALDRLANTHLHSDHCGGNAALQARYPTLTTLIPPGLAAHVETWNPEALSYSPTGQQCAPFKFDQLLEPGGEVLLGDWRWEIHSAQGHDPHAVILFEPQSQTLLSADALWENGFGIVFPELEGERAFEEVAVTLDLIEHLAPRTVVPGHGPLFNHVGKSLGIARQRLEHFAQAPTKHARHAAKVLLKFKLLELQRAPAQALLRWAEQTAYFDLVYKRYFSHLAKDAWLLGLLEELVSAGAARKAGNEIIN